MTAFIVTMIVWHCLCLIGNLHNLSKQGVIADRGYDVAAVVIHVAIISWAVALLAGRV